MATTRYPNLHIVCIVGIESCQVFEVNAAPCNNHNNPLLGSFGIHSL